MPRRTTRRRRTGTKLYVRRDRKGQFADVQSYNRAHGSDIKRRSKAEAAKRVGKTATRIRTPKARRTG